MFNNTEKIPGPRLRRHSAWSNSETFQLIEMVKDRDITSKLDKPRSRNQQYYRSLANEFTMIGSIKDWDQIKWKFKSLQQKYMTIVTSGIDTSNWLYFEKMHEIMHNQPHVKVILDRMQRKKADFPDQEKDEVQVTARAKASVDCDTKNATAYTNHHAIILSQMCRICGFVNEDISCRRLATELDDLPKVAQAFGIDTTNDVPNVHPKCVCKSCQLEANFYEEDEEFVLTRQLYRFQSHECIESCDVCKNPCPACLLVPATAITEQGSIRRGLTDNDASRERHKALLKSSSHICERNEHKPTTPSGKCACLDVLMQFPNHQANCGLCVKPCHLCGNSFNAETISLYKIQYCSPTVVETLPLKQGMKRKYLENIRMLKPRMQAKQILLYQNNQPANIVAYVPSTSNQKTLPAQKKGSEVVNKQAEKQGKPIEFGYAPVEVAKKFLDMVSNSGSLSQCISELLALSASLFFKYKFIDTETKCVLLGVPTIKDTQTKLLNQLKQLDEYAASQNLSSRAAALEELMFSSLNNSSHITALLTEMNNAKPETRSTGMQSETPNAGERNDDLVFLGKTSDFVSLLHKSFTIKHINQNESNHTWKCYFCMKIFVQHRKLLKHCWNHCQYFDYTCANCKLPYQTPSDMYQHVIMEVCVNETVTETSGEKRQEGEMQILPDKYTGIVPQHYRPFTATQNDGKSNRVRCMVCNFVSGFNSMVHHTRQHIGDFPYRCCDCGFASVCPTRLYKHQNSSGHSRFIFMQREKPLSRIEKQDVMANLHQTLDGVFLQGFYEGHQHEDSIDKTSSESDSETNDIESPDKTWLFCKNCNSAFFDQDAHMIHVKTCMPASQEESSNTVVKVEPHHLNSPDLMEEPWNFF